MLAVPEPDLPPVTTIAWRLGHMIVRVIGRRASNHSVTARINYQSFDYAGTAAAALRHRVAAGGSLAAPRYER